MASLHKGTVLSIGLLLSAATTLAAAEYTPDPHAGAFARRVQEVNAVLQENSIARPSSSRLTELALRGLYKSQGKDVPGDLIRRLRNNRASEKDLLAVLSGGYSQLAEHRELDEDRAVDEAVTSALKQLDPQASWRPTPETVCYLGVTCGIGVELRHDAKSRQTRVVTPIKDSPAYRAGIRAGDVITHVANLREPAPINDVVPDPSPAGDGPARAIATLLQGDPGSKLLLLVERKGVKTPLRLIVTRGPAPSETVQSWRRKNDDSWDYRLDEKKKIGYLRIVVFSRKTAKELETALDELETQGVRRVVLDLRNCPGGLLDGALKSAGLFLDKDVLVMKVRSAAGKEIDLFHENNTARPRLTVVCLINDATSSAAELFAAALQDHHRAIIVGERSRGNSNCRIILSVNQHDLTLTTAVYLRPNGKKLDRIRLPGHGEDEWGVTPDSGNVVQLTRKEIDALREHLEQRRIIPRRDVPVTQQPAFKDRQLERALEVLTTNKRGDHP